MPKVSAAGFQFPLGNYTEDDIVVAEESVEGRDLEQYLGAVQNLDR